MKKSDGSRPMEVGRHDTDFDTDTRINYRGFLLMLKEEGRRVTRGLVYRYPLLPTNISGKTRPYKPDFWLGEIEPTRRFFREIW